MNGTVVLYLVLLGAQLVAFLASLAFWFASRESKLSPAARAKAGYRSNFASAAGFACMAFLALAVEDQLPADAARMTWFSGIAFLLFAIFLGWLGLVRKRSQQ